MMKATTNHSVAHVTITKLLMMAVATGKGVGAKKVFTRGSRPAVKICSYPREIRQGGV